MARLFRRRLDERLVDLSITDAQWRVIGFLYRGEGLTQTELALLLGMQKAPLGEHIDKLEALGYLLRRRDVTDRRINRLYLTPLACVQAEGIAKRFRQLSLELQAGMSESLWQSLQQGLIGLFKTFPSGQVQLILPRLKLENNLFYLGLLSRQLRKQFDGALKELGFTRSRWQVLSAVIHHEGISQVELGALLDIAKAPLGQVLDTLEQQQWICRQKDSSDGRVKRLFVASAAKPMVTQLFERYQQLHALGVDALGEQELDLLKVGLSSLRKRLLDLSIAG